jgi:hypothetical protein
MLSFELREVLVCTQIHTPFLTQALLPLALKKIKSNKTKQNKTRVEKNLTHSLTHSLRDHCLLPKSLVWFSFELRLVEQVIRERERDVGYTISLLNTDNKEQSVSEQKPSLVGKHRTNPHTYIHCQIWAVGISLFLSFSLHPLALHVGGLSLTCFF